VWQPPQLQRLRVLHNQVQLTRRIIYDPFQAIPQLPWILHIIHRQRLTESMSKQRRDSRHKLYLCHLHAGTDARASSEGQEDIFYVCELDELFSPAAATVVLIEPSGRFEFGCVCAPDLRVQMDEYLADKDVHGRRERVVPVRVDE
jgi:hypothetical protein